MQIGTAVGAGIWLTASLLAVQATWAVDPTTHITQYAHTTWRLQEGFFTGAPTAIAQTTDGYLWIGTESGLFRFDGVRFVPWADLSPEKQLRSAQVSALLGARDGSLWIGASYSLFRWKDSTLSQYSTRSGFVTSIIQTRNNAIWLSRDRYADQDGALCRVEDRAVHCFGRRQGDPLPYALSLAEDAGGNLWNGAGTQLVRWQSGSSTTWTLKSLKPTAGLDGIQALAVDRKDSLWVGINYPRSGLGLEQLRKGVLKTFHSPHLNGAKLRVSKLFVDRDGALWVGTEDQGIYRILGGKAEHFDSADGLSGDTITDLFQDAEGTLWVATSRGIDRFRDLPIVTLSRREGLHEDDAGSVLAAPDGTVWIGNEGALDAWHHDVITSITAKDGLPGQEVTSLFEDRAGRLWVGIDNGLFLFEHRKFIPVIQPGGPNIVFSMASGADGDVWALTAGATTGTLIQIHHRDWSVRQTFPPQDSEMALAADARGGLWIAGDKLRYRDDSGERTISAFGPRYGYIRNIAVDRNNAVWFGATKGLVALRDGKLQVMTTDDGLPCDWINTLIFDQHRSLWLYAQCGLIRIKHGALEAWWRHPDTQIETTLFDGLDGFQGGLDSFRPAATESPDGRLWFVNGSVVQTIDPDHLYLNHVPPPIHIGEVIADAHRYSSRTTIRLPKLTRNIEVQYTGLSFVAPQRVRFRYKLDGYDPDWQNAGTRRSAFYTNLRPGTYKFEVTACNNSSIWNREGAALTFVIPPAWYQTRWSRLIALLSIILLSYALYLLRMRQFAAAMKARFCERLDERTRIARELHDTLLQSFHGLMFRFQAARNLLPTQPETAMQTLDKAILATEQAITEGRDAIRDLRPDPVTQNDLAQFLNAVGEELTGNPSAPGPLPNFHVMVEGKPRQLSPTLQCEVYRIGREVIRNAFRHAASTRIEVEVLYDEHQLRLRIRDDGKGIAPQDLESSGRPGHWGLPGLRERAQHIGSRLELWSEAGAGTEVELRVPAAIAYEKKRDGHRLRLFRRDSHS